MAKRIILRKEWADLIKHYVEFYGVSELGKTIMLLALLVKLHELFSSVAVEAYGSEISESSFDKCVEELISKGVFTVGDFPVVNWHRAIRAQAILQHKNCVILIEDAHEIVTKTNARTLRKLINGAGRKNGCLTIDVLQGRDFGSYRLPHVAFQVYFEDKYKFLLKFVDRREEGPFDVGGFNLEKGADAIVDCLFNDLRPVGQVKGLPGRLVVADSLRQQVFRALKAGKTTTQIVAAFPHEKVNVIYQYVAEYRFKERQKRV